MSGKDGFSRVLPLLPRIDVAIVGEPTGMHPAIAEKGLMVIDGTAHGVSGHAARGEGVMLSTKRSTTSVSFVITGSRMSANCSAQR